MPSLSARTCGGPRTSAGAAWPGVGPYAATKAALALLSRVARAELAGDNIVVSTIFPYVTATEFHSRLRAGELRRPTGAGATHIVADTAEHVADDILRLIRTGEEEAVLLPS
jgi:short-subunit dehydrogenase